METKVAKLRERLTRRRTKIAKREAPAAVAKALGLVNETRREPVNRAERRAAVRGRRSAHQKQQPRERATRRAFAGIYSRPARQILFWGCAVPAMEERARKAAGE